MVFQALSVASSTGINIPLTFQAFQYNLPSRCYQQKERCGIATRYSKIRFPLNLQEYGKQQTRKRKAHSSMSLRPLNPQEARRVLPKVGTREQLAAFWGVTEEEKAEKLTEVFMIPLTGLFACWWATFVVGVEVASLFGFVFIFYWLLAPNYFAFTTNLRLHGNLATSINEPGTFAALFSARISEIKNVGRSKYKPGRTVLSITAEDQEGKILTIQVNDLESYSKIRVGMRCEVVVLSSDASFRRIDRTTDLYVPACDTWVGEYPYLDKARFKWLAAQNFALERSNIPEKDLSADLEAGELELRNIRSN